jgi:hypothetical protein
MIHLPASVLVYLCLTPCDMRKSFDSLQALVRELTFAKNTSDDRSPSDISVLAMEQIRLRRHKETREGRNRDVTHCCMPQISICRSPETEPPERLETRALVVRRIFDEGQVPGDNQPDRKPA